MKPEGDADRVHRAGPQREAGRPRPCLGRLGILSTGSTRPVPQRGREEAVGRPVWALIPVPVLTSREPPRGVSTAPLSQLRIGVPAPSWGRPSQVPGASRARVCSPFMKEGGRAGGIPSACPVLRFMSRPFPGREPFPGSGWGWEARKGTWNAKCVLKAAAPEDVVLCMPPARRSLCRTGRTGSCVCSPCPGAPGGWEPLCASQSPMLSPSSWAHARELRAVAGWGHPAAAGT